MDSTNLYYYIAFSHFLGIGPYKFSFLLSSFGTAQKAYDAHLEELQKVLGSNLASKFDVFRKKFDPEKKMQELRAKEIRVILRDEKTFPESLRQIPDPPICLYVKGEIDRLNFDNEFFFAIVGTRTPSTYGQQIARKFARELAEAGFLIVSGMAIGIDTAAHCGTLDVKGKTIAFLGCGVDIIYPSQNTSLYKKIISSGGLIISEFPPGHTVKPGLFIARNRLISGISRGVLVVEGAKDSGALITARYAAEQGKDVFAPPVPLTSSLSEAPNFLLKQGAKFVSSVEDILEEYHIKCTPKTLAKITELLSYEEKTFVDRLMNEPQSSDELVWSLHYSIGDILRILSLLEIKGIVEKNSEGKYQIKS